MTKRDEYVYKIAFRDGILVSMKFLEGVEDPHIDIREFVHKHCTKMMAEFKKENKDD